VVRHLRDRRLATVLFIDIVGSTALATELGDRRFRELFTRFWRVVRAELKRGGGREQDPAGDGLAAIFDEPALALRSASAIARAVQALGVDVRAGLHTGECEVVEGKLRGIAVHISARVMALAGPAELLVTGTVRELVAGSEVEFEEHGLHALKGVPGEWQLYRVVAVEATRLPAPLTSEEVRARTGAITVSERRPRVRRFALLAAAALGAIGMAVATPLLTLGKDGQPRTHAASVISLLRIDADSGRIARLVRDRDVSPSLLGIMWMSSGTIWEWEPDPKSSVVVARDASSGRVLRRISFPNDATALATGFGSLWILRRDIGAARVDRIDELSGRRVAMIRLRGLLAEPEHSDINVAGGSVWVLDDQGTMTEIDPRTNRRGGTYPAPSGRGGRSSLGRIWYLPTGTVWPFVIARFDPRTHSTRVFRLPQRWDDSSGLASTLWLLDGFSGTLTPMNSESGQLGAVVGLAGKPWSVVASRGIVWVAAGSVVDRVDPSTYPPRRTTIAMPQGFTAGIITADPVNDAIWVGNLARRNR
jgi:class 3 adenylate cyclase